MHGDRWLVEIPLMDADEGPYIERRENDRFDSVIRIPADPEYMFQMMGKLVRRDQSGIVYTVKKVEDEAPPESH